MSKNLKLATLSVAVFAGLLIAYWGGYQTAQITELTSTEVISEAPVAQVPDRATSEETKPAPLKEAAPVEEVEPPAEPVNIPGNYEYFDEEGISAEAAAEYRQMAVLPYNPLMAECEHKWTTHDGRTESIYTEICTYKRKYPEHPYFDYSTEGLLELTKNNDALAAAVLSEKLKDEYPSEAIALAIYSTFISSKRDQLLKIANAKYRTNGVPQKIKHENTAPRYVYTSIAQKMGHPAADLSFADYLSTEELSLLEASAQDIYTKLKADADAGEPLIGDFSPFIELLHQRNKLGDKT